MAQPAFAGIDHIGLLVRDIDASLPYYTEQLGLKLISDETTAASGGARLVFLDAGNMVLQLVAPLGPGIIADALSQQGEGLHHICAAVSDIDDAIARLAPDESVTVSIGGRGRRTAFLPKRSNGLVLELTEKGPPSPDNGKIR